MKRMGVFILCFIIKIGAQAAQATYRTFTDTEGREIKARILSVDSESGTVKLERDNRRRATAPINVFSEDDQNYIQQWGKISAFTSESTFRISGEKDTQENETAARKLEKENHAIDFWVEETCYRIQLNNRSSTTLSNLKAEYCVYYSQDHPSGEDEGIFCGSLEIPDIRPDTEKTLTTEAVLTYRSRLQSGFIYNNGSSTHQNGKVEGLWIKIFMNADGKKVVRQFSIPDDLQEEKRWRTESVVAGIN